MNNKCLMAYKQTQLHARVNILARTDKLVNIRKQGRNRAFLLFSNEKQGRNSEEDGGIWPKYLPLRIYTSSRHPRRITRSRSQIQNNKWRTRWSSVYQNLHLLWHIGCLVCHLKRLVCKFKTILLKPMSLDRFYRSQTIILKCTLRQIDEFCNFTILRLYFIHPLSYPKWR